MTVTTALGLLAFAIWLYLLVARGGFWLARERDDRESLPAPGRWPSVVAVVPARNEADVIAQSISSLMRQDYPGSFRIVLVDDGSEDGTAAKALAAGEARLQILRGSAPPAGWTGKLWAQQQGVQQASSDEPDYLLLTDADIGHAPDTLRSLVARADRAALVRG
jgi:glycosyltransferase involved in cell wall biosynthesis